MCIRDRYEATLSHLSRVVGMPVISLVSHHEVLRQHTGCDHWHAVGRLMFA